MIPCTKRARKNICLSIQSTDRRISLENVEKVNIGIILLVQNTSIVN